MSQRAMASYLGVSHGKVQSWTEGQRPSADDLQTMALKLGLSPRWLLLGVGDPEGQDLGAQAADPLVLRLDAVARAMREAGASEESVLRTLRDMVDGEIAKLASEEAAAGGLARAAEDRADYGGGGPAPRSKAAGGGD